MDTKDDQISQKHAKPAIRHVFDGIEEEDNDLPRWWLNMFYISIVFSVIYMAYYHWPLGIGLSPEEEFEIHMTALKEQEQDARAAGFDYTAVVDDAAMLEAGKTTYMEMCVPCHGEQGQGSVGPNLTDQFWIVEPTFAGVEQIITEGNLEKGMPAWGPIIGPDKVKQLVVFVRSLQSKAAAAGKEPQGIAGSLP